MWQLPFKKLFKGLLGFDLCDKDNEEANYQCDGKKQSHGQIVCPVVAESKRDDSRNILCSYCSLKNIYVHWLVAAPQLFSLEKYKVEAPLLRSRGVRCVSTGLEFFPF